jgi:predicted membrane channel-forming protein YqfA (hemolysin III family)
MNAGPKASDERNFAFLRVMIYLDFVLVILFFLVQLGQQSHTLSDCRDVLHEWEIMTRILILFSGVFIFCCAAVVYVSNQRSFRQDLGHYLAAGCAVIASVAVQFLNFRAMVR